MFSTNTGTYDISQMTYPSDLMDPIYAGNMVVFFINVATASKFANSYGDTFDMAAVDTILTQETLLARNISGLNSAISATASSLLPGLVVGSTTGFGGAVSVGGAISAGSLYAAYDIAGTTTREKKRLKSAIALHMPNALNIKYTVSWAEEDTAGAEMASILGEDAVGMLKTMGDVMPSSMKDIPAATDKFINSSSAQKSGADIKSMVASLGLANAPGGAYMSARTGLAANPRKEMVFKGVDFRTFSFDYSFFPRSIEEANNVEQIIQTFKFHMHPEYKDTNSFLYLYPSEFDISYYTKDGENAHIHKHTSCVLTDLSINYTPNGNFNTFSNGMPTQINISLTFKELSSPSKETIEKGL
ncbi:Baseplate tail-tube protein gp48, T4-like virus [uncultured Caudovirales phage]|uniref:Baseplate tail-tube protein gp48, T4-like virus n=1 Tax=uncultured Caudovirales phage TaxID=2100421 RepID=A0A6J5KX63_9CAUD|nr:Baseplate tail-tube protein gp48, T4-like virus [uncultured Caudovirales phage]